MLPQSPLFQYFDTVVVYEGETAFVQLVSAVGAKRSLADVPNTIYKDGTGVHVSATSFAEDMSALPPPDFDGLPLDKYFVPTKILPYLATRGCYWGRCLMRAQNVMVENICCCKTIEMPTTSGCSASITGLTRCSNTSR